MRDRRFVREHRGGTLTLEKHRMLMRWGLLCAEHAMRFLGKKIDARIRRAMKVAKNWEKGTATVGEAREAAYVILKLARELTDPAAIAAARGVGHAVATAHMADHALGPAIYALQAVRAAGGSQKAVEKERAWQIGKLPRGIARLAIEGLAKKESRRND